jgi:hypothetical protein
MVGKWYSSRLEDITINAGKHHINLFITIKSDLNLRGYSLNCIEDLYLAKDVARDRKKWQSLFNE